MASGVGMLDDRALVSPRLAPPDGGVKMNSAIELVEQQHVYQELPALAIMHIV